jgi:hypothetical protein
MKNIIIAAIIALSWVSYANADFPPLLDVNIVMRPAESVAARESSVFEDHVLLLEVKNPHPSKFWENIVRIGNVDKSTDEAPGPRVFSEGAYIGLTGKAAEPEGKKGSLNVLPSPLKDEKVDTSVMFFMKISIVAKMAEVHNSKGVFCVKLSGDEVKLFNLFFRKLFDVAYPSE